MMPEYSPSSQSYPGARPMWQLLLVEQTGGGPPLTGNEYLALADFLGSLIAEGYDSDIVSRRMAHCLAQARKHGVED